MDWKPFEEEIIKVYPFLDKIRFGFKESAEHFSMPPLLTIGSFAAINILNDDSTSARLAIIFPHSDTIACYIAAAASLAAIKKQFDRGLPKLPELKPDEKVLLDGADYIYKGEEVLNGVPFMIFEYDGGFQRKPFTDRLRVQHSISKRKLTKRDKKPIKSIIDQILDIKLQANTSLFQTSVILVSQVGKTYQQVYELNLASDDANTACLKLAHAFGWGSLTEDGEIKIWGSVGRREEPLVLVSSNFADVCEYIEVNSHKTDLIVVDGASYLKDLSSFETLLSKNISVVFILSGKDQYEIQYLKKKDFDFWAWNSDDLKSLHQDLCITEENPFYHLTRKIESFASFDAEVIDCSNPAFEKVFELLNQIRREITDEDYHASQILDQIYSFFSRVSRLVAAADQIKEKSNSQISSIETNLQTFRFYLKPEFYEKFAEVVEFLKQGNAELNGENSKPARLRSLIGKLLSSGCEKICVVLSKSDFQVEKDYLSSQFPGRKVVYERNASFKMREDYDCVILCGYLKRNHLLRIFDEALGSRLIILNYPHEKEWTRSVKRQFFGAFDNQAFRNGKVFGKNLQISSPVNPSSEPSPQMPALEEFEIKLHEFKKQRILRNINEDSGGQKVAAKCVTFNQGSFAFLTESYSVPVINELLGGKKVERIPQKRIKDISPGDFLLFRESSGRDLIREMADVGLARSGNSKLREFASQWREALERIYEKNGKSLSKVKAELKKHECDRNELTIKNWLFDENQIAPGEDADILAIAAAADDGILLKKYDDIIAAISQVRGAHIQAARQVARLLEKRVKGDLEDLSESDVEIKVPGLGKVYIVCVESIDSGFTDVPGHKANRILTEKEQDNGTNDSAAIVG